MNQFQIEGSEQVVYIDRLVSGVEFLHQPLISDVQREIEPGGRIFNELFRNGYVDGKCVARVGFDLEFSKPTPTARGTYYLRYTATPKLEIKWLH